MQRTVCAAVVAMLLGCGSRPPIAEFSFVTTRLGAVHPEILKRNVEGEYCFSQGLFAWVLRPPWMARFADHGRAIDAAIKSVPDANVMSEIRVRVRVENYLLVQRICAIATGNVGKLE